MYVKSINEFDLLQTVHIVIFQYIEALDHQLPPNKMFIIFRHLQDEVLIMRKKQSNLNIPES